jgi:2-phospho-L-lactate guanylyltransferase
MATLVVPFRGEGAKSRLGEAGPTLARAMLTDVLVACDQVGTTALVTDDTDAREIATELGAAVIDDPGGGQGAAVAAAVERLTVGPVLIVNADLPCVRPDDLEALLAAIPPEGLALVAATDGTTNALGLAEASLFAPLYGPGSAEEFRAHASQLGVPSLRVDIPNLADDVDTVEDLERLEDRLGDHTRAALAELREASPQ